VSGRTRKVESQLKEIAGEEVASLSDPRIQGLVTVTGVRVSPDLAQATVFYSVLAGRTPKPPTRGFRAPRAACRPPSGRRRASDARRGCASSRTPW
jgi:hypothetical protein